MIAEMSRFYRILGWSTASSRSVPAA